MGCGCAGRAPKMTRSGDPSVERIAVYEVVKDGQTKLRTTSATAARQEAKILGASVKVSSQNGGGTAS